MLKGVNFKEIESIQQQQQSGPIDVMISFNTSKSKIVVAPSQTVDEVLKQAIDSHPTFTKNSAIELEWGLFMPYPVGSWLKNGVKLSKYGLKSGVELELKVKSRGGFKQTTTQGESLQFLKIEIPEGNEIYTRTLKFKKEIDTVEDVIKQITKKYKINVGEDWGLFDSNANKWIEPLNSTLSECGLQHMHLLVFKKREN